MRMVLTKQYNRLMIPIKHIEIIEKIAGDPIIWLDSLIEKELKQICIEKVDGGVRVMYNDTCIDSAQCDSQDKYIYAFEHFTKLYKI